MGQITIRGQKVKREVQGLPTERGAKQCRKDYYNYIFRGFPVLFPLSNPVARRSDPIVTGITWYPRYGA